MWHFLEGTAVVIFCVDTVVDLNTVQVKSTVQLHGSSFEDCRESHFNSIPDAALCLIVDGKNPHVLLIDGSISLCSRLSCQTNVIARGVRRTVY